MRERGQERAEQGDRPIFILFLIFYSQSPAICKSTSRQHQSNHKFPLLSAAFCLIQCRIRPSLHCCFISVHRPQEKKNTTVRALTHLAFHPGSLISSGMLSGRQKSYGHRLFTDVEPAFISNPVIFQQVGKSNCYGFSVGRSSAFPPFHSSSITMPDELISSRRREGRVPTRCPPTVPKPTRTAHGHRIEAPLTILNSRIPEGGSPQTIPY